MTQANVFQVLSFIVQQLNHSRDICNSLQVCKSWKACLAESTSSLDVYIGAASIEGLGKLAALTSWLQQYGSLLHSLHIGVGQAASPAGVAVAESLVIQALQLAAAKGKPLLLQQLGTSALQSQSFLPSLPAATLTSLALYDMSPSPATTRALASGLGCLTNLRSLKLTGPLWGEPSLETLPAYCVSGLQQLTSLTQVEVYHMAGGRPMENLWEAGTEQHFPGQLKSLVFRGCDAGSLDIRHLTCLQSLDFHSAKALMLQQLPSQLSSIALFTPADCQLRLSHVTFLRSLSLEARGGMDGSSSLPRSLTSLSLTNTPLSPFGLPELLAHVVQLEYSTDKPVPSGAFEDLRKAQALKDLSLSYSTVAAAVAVAGQWKQLLQLRSLVLTRKDPDEMEEGEEGEEEEGVLEAMPLIIQEAGLARSLTRLELNMHDGDYACGEHWAHLSNLQVLRLMCLSTSRGDLLQLKALTQLTELTFCSIDVDDASLVRLLYSFTQLRELHLKECEELSDVVVPVIAHQLKGLRSLTLGLESVNDESIPLLLELTQLSMLNVVCSGLTLGLRVREALGSYRCVVRVNWFTI